MPRKLKSYQTSIGFFELAIAAPSMKAALEAWGSKSNLFHQGLAQETQDPAIVAATMAKPDVVLKRAVGSNDAFNEDAKLPGDLGGQLAKQPASKAPRSAKEPQARKLDDEAAVAAARALNKEKKQRERGREKEAAARERQHEQRELAIAKAETALEEAKRMHEAKIEEVDRERAALDSKLEAENDRWLKQRAKLEAVLARAQE